MVISYPPKRLGAIIWLVLMSGTGGLQAQPESQHKTWVEVEGVAQQKIIDLYNRHCADCHGKNMQGAAQGVPLRGRDLAGGDSVNELMRSIEQGAPVQGMPAWTNVLSDIQIRSLAIYVSEQRQGLIDNEFRISDPIRLPEDTVHSEVHAFNVRTVAEDINPLPFGMTVLPNGNFLVTEKHKGLVIITRDGKRSPVSGTPEVTPTVAKGAPAGGLDTTTGWLLDVELHPDYEKNGWIYLSHTHLCHDCERDDWEQAPGFLSDLIRTNVPSMTRLLRGRIINSEWRDEEVIWAAPKATYTQAYDLLACGAVTFDDTNHVYVTIGAKKVLNLGIQDLSLPYGKIIRVHDDGRIPSDNPFVDIPGALKSIWSYGHRTPQGLEFDPENRTLWSSEHGPKGGDEINLIHGGANYGWPLYSLGVYYDGSEVGKVERAGMDFNLSDIQQPVVDLTPSPAVSEILIYKGDQFPRWRDNLLVGTLKATQLLRIELEDNKVVRRETLLQDIGRVREVKTGPDGNIYLLIEHAEGSKILEISPSQSHDRPVTELNVLPAMSERNIDRE